MRVRELSKGILLAFKGRQRISQEMLERKMTWETHFSILITEISKKFKTDVWWLLATEFCLPTTGIHFAVAQTGKQTDR